MLKITIDNEEVVSNKDFTIEEEMLNTSSVILNNVYPKVWEEDKDYVSRFYYPKDYSKCKIFNEIVHPEEQGQTATGTNLTLEIDTTKQNEITQIEGNLEQTGTPTPSNPQPINVVSGRQEVSVVGKNLINTLYQHSAGDVVTSNGVTYTFNEDGSITINGTATGTSYALLYGSSLNDYQTQRFIVNGNYKVGNWNNNNIYLMCRDQSALYKAIYKGNNYGGSDIKDISGLPLGVIYIQVSGTVNNTTIYPQIEMGNTPTSYEAYKGKSYEINLGKNLWNVKDTTINLLGITGVCKDGIITLNGTATANAFLSFYLDNTFSWVVGQTYSISCFNESTAEVRLRVNSGGGLDTAMTTNQNTTKVFEYTGTPTDVFTNRIQIRVGNGTTLTDFVIKPQIEIGSTPSSYSPYKTPIYLGAIGNYKDYIYKDNGKWYIHKEIGKVVLNGSESGWGKSGSTDFDRFFTPILDLNTLNINYGLSNYYKYNLSMTSLGDFKYEHNSASGKDRIFINHSAYGTTTLAQFKTWLSSNNVEVYYVLNTPTNTLLDDELQEQLNSIQFLEGLNNISVSSPYLSGILNIHYNYQEGYTEEDVLFCGIVKNTGEISLNPRYPHFCNIQVLDFKDFLSQGETLDFVIANKTINEAIDQIITTISDYGFVKGNIQLTNASDIIGAYSTKDKTAYDVFNYIADITQSRWTTRMIDENTVAVDFYDPNLLPEGTAIEYTQTWFKNNLIDDMNYSYSSNDYRNRQVMTSNEVFGNLAQQENKTANGYSTQFNTEQKIGIANAISVDGVQKTIITNEEKELGETADFYYSVGNNYIESDSVLSAGDVITINYTPIVQGRQVINNASEIARVNANIGRKGVIARYENRNDATTSKELQLIGQSYIKYKGTPEIKLEVSTRSNLWNIGDRVQFNAPITELATEYMVKSKKINYITSVDTIFYSYELSSSFNMEQDINYFDNQRAKAKGNIGEGEYISRNVDIENTGNIIFYDFQATEVQVEGDNTLNSVLDAPFIV